MSTGAEAPGAEAAYKYCTAATTAAAASLESAVVLVSSKHQQVSVTGSAGQRS